mgnify:CR=1 FL=1
MNFKKIGIILIVLAVTLLVFQLYSGKFSGDIGSKNAVECLARVDADVFSEMDLEEVTCTKKGNCLISYYLQLPFNLISNEGKINFDAGDSNDIEKVDLSGIGEEIVKGALCTTSSSVNVKLYNDIGVLVDSRNVVIK